MTGNFTVDGSDWQQWIHGSFLPSQKERRPETAWASSWDVAVQGALPPLKSSCSPRSNLTHIWSRLHNFPICGHASTIPIDYRRNRGKTPPGYSWQNLKCRKFWENRYFIKIPVFSNILVGRQRQNDKREYIWSKKTKNRSEPNSVCGPSLILI